jgi:hypothetical protein
MKTLKDHTLVYDATCPMCRLYTRAFVSSGMLDQEGRAPYQKECSCALLDRQRAVNEIALVNRKTGAVTYGVESLFCIIGNSWPWLRPLFAFRPFAWVAGKAYSFISYNRRIIMPAPKDPADTPPAFNRGWRATWIFYAWLLTAFILFRYSHRMTGVIPASNVYREFAVCGGQILWQGLLLQTIAPAKVWDYLGNMMTVSLAGGIALALIGVVLNISGTSHPILATACFLLVAGLMFLEHLRRCRLLELGLLVSASWVFYRLLLLYFILN